MIFGTIGFIFLMVSAPFLSSSKVYFDLGFASVSSYSLCGFVTVSQTLLAVLIVLYCKTKGFYLTLVLYICDALFTILHMLLSGTATGIPGIASAFGGVVIIYVIKNCISKISVKEEELKILANTDSLTQLPNRRALEKTIADLSNIEKPFAFALVDIDNFKNINDSMGHVCGDKMLTEITRRWNSVKQENDILFRIGGDEFTFIITDFSNKDEITSRAERYLFCFKDKFVIEGKNFYTSASMGISIYPENACDYISLLKYADTAMYMAKKQGKHRFCLFSDAQTASVMSNIQDEEFLRKAVKDERFSLVFQPQYSGGGTVLRGFEALLRIVDENGNLLLPADFIHLAEKINIVTDIDRWVLKNAMKTFKPALEVNDKLKLSINVSVSYLFDDLFLSDVKKFSEEVKIDPSNLEIELTETPFISSLQKTNEILSSLRDMGVSVALDDFGTGYSSLSFLDSLPIDTLKIDKSFIDDLDDEKERTFVKAIITLGHLLRFKIVSEGVEDSDQMNSLESFGCDIIQGYLLGKPESFERTMDLIYEGLCDEQADN